MAEYSNVICAITIICAFLVGGSSEQTAGGEAPSSGAISQGWCRFGTGRHFASKPRLLGSRDPFIVGVFFPLWRVLVLCLRSVVRRAFGLFFK